MQKAAQIEIGMTDGNIASFVSEKCTIDPAGRESVTDLYAAYRATGGKLTCRVLVHNLYRRFSRISVGGRYYVEGLRLIA